MYLLEAMITHNIHFVYNWRKIPRIIKYSLISPVSMFNVVMKERKRKYGSCIMVIFISCHIFYFNGAY